MNKGKFIVLNVIYLGYTTLFERVYENGSGRIMQVI